MSLKYGLYLPIGFVGDLASFKDPTEAYETLTHMAQTADELGYETVWLPDHLLTAPPSQAMLFESWITASAVVRDAFTFHAPAVAGTSARFVGMMRAPVRAASDAVTVLSELIWANLRASRRLGHLSHQLFLRHAAVVEARPASNARRSGGEDTALPVEPVEVLVVDFWPTLEGLTEYYHALLSTNGLNEVLAGSLTVSVWEAASGFVEW